MMKLSDKDAAVPRASQGTYVIDTPISKRALKGARIGVGPLVCHEPIPERDLERKAIKSVNQSENQRT
jgi:hypothetical protein